ncbi:MAG: cytidylate kinase-like family protein [Campylobacter sp.]|nr:cytidylate kinase-like family protein [Campylobacter sp.]
MIICIGRQTGSGGGEIVSKLAKELDLTLLDGDRLLYEADELGYYEQMYRFCAETPVSELLQAIASEISIETKNIIRDFYDKLLKKDDYIVLGRCANFFLRDKSNFASFFLSADDEFKLTRLKNRGVKGDIKEYMQESDTKRASFHRYYTNEVWGGSSYYDLCINSSRLGIEKSLELIKHYIELRGIKREF